MKLDPDISIRRDSEFFKYVAVRHSSPLLRRLGESDIRLQRQKIINLTLAADILDGVIIPPGKIFSFWNAIGNPTYGRGFVDGMLLSRGKVIEGVGGGLCQLSNLLHWAFLHTPMNIVERAHHSFDAFPDSGRTLPFGSGATIFYNLIDLRVKNVLETPVQMHIWLAGGYLRIQLRSPVMIPEKYHVYQKNHRFVRSNGSWFRANEIWRQTLIDGKVINDEKLYENFAPVMYPVSEMQKSPIE